ncbi:MAG: YIP1 family protein [Blastocatellia bacterium]
MNPELSYVNQAGPDPAPAPQSFFSRLTGVYFSPGETFQEIGRAPAVVVPIIVLALLTIGVVFVVSQRISFEKVAIQRIDDGVAEGKITAEQAEQQKEGMKKFAPIFKIAIPFIAGIFVVVAALVIAGLAKLISSMMGIENKFLPLFGVTLYTMLAVSIISSVLLIILLYLKPADEIDPNNPMGSNLAALLSMAGVTSLPKFLKALLTYVDVFYIWKVVLLGIGYAAVSRKLKTSTAIVYASVGALVFALIGAAWGALFG